MKNLLKKTVRITTICLLVFAMSFNMTVFAHPNTAKEKKDSAKAQTMAETQQEHDIAVEISSNGKWSDTTNKKIKTDIKGEGKVADARNNKNITISDMRIRNNEEYAVEYTLSVKNAEKGPKAEKTAEAEKIKILENGKKQSDMRYQQIISEAKMNARRAELGAKEDVIEAAFNQAIGELKIKASSGDEEYKDSLSKMIMEATNEIGSNDLILQLNEADTQKFKDDLSSQGSDSFEIEGIKFTLGEPIDAIGGAILKTANGDIEVNNTIEARLERFKSILRSEVAEILFK